MMSHEDWLVNPSNLGSFDGPAVVSEVPTSGAAVTDVAAQGVENAARAAITAEKWLRLAIGERYAARRSKCCNTPPSRLTTRNSSRHGIVGSSDPWPSSGRLSRP